VGANPVCILVPCHRVGDGSPALAWGSTQAPPLAHEGSAALPLFTEGATL
jgi:O6-methylguanine-DNA--protein-cysteine methyltransferase